MPKAGRWVLTVASMLAAGSCGPVGTGDGALSSTPLSACDDPRAVEILAPTRFTRARGRPSVDTEAFSAPFDGEFCVIVRNGSGDPPHGERVSSAEISIDDDALFGPEDFNQRIAEQREAVDLSVGDHALAVRLASAPGSFLEISIRALPAPGVPLTVQITPSGTVTVPESGEATITVEILDVNDLPVSGVTVQLDTVQFPHASEGVFFADELLNRFVYSASEAPVAATAVTDATGAAEVLADPRGLGLYLIGVTVPHAPWISQDYFYLEAVPNPGAWFDRTGTLTATPSARANPNMMFDTARRRVLLFGGRDPGTSTEFNDIWALALPSDPVAPPTSWESVIALTPSAPPATGGTAAIYDPARDRIVVMTGGPTGELEVWAFNFDDAAGLDGTWSEISLTIGAGNTLPVPIAAHLFGAAVYDPIRDRMLHFGGITQPQPPPDFGFTSDLLIVDFGSDVVTGVVAIDDESPTSEPVTPRSLPGAVFDVERNRMIVYGGHFQFGAVPADPFFLGDAWQGEFRVDALGVWTELDRRAGDGTICTPTNLGCPTDRRNFSFANDSARERAVMYGGMMGAPTTPRPSTDEVWQMRYHEDGRIIWDRLEPALPGPTARDAHSAGAVFDLDAARMFVFGGIRPESGPPGDLLFDETWELNWDFRPPFDGQVVLEFNHWAIFNDGLDAATLEVSKDIAAVPVGLTVTGARVRLNPNPFLFPPAGGVVVPGPGGPTALDTVTFVPLADDGTRGDDIAGDGVFQLGPVRFSGAIGAPELPQRIVFEASLDLSDGSTVTAGVWLNVVEAGTVVTTTPVAAPVPPEFTVSHSTNVLFITDPFLLLNPSYRNGGIDIGSITSFAYQFLDDRYEWATVMATRAVRELDSMVISSSRGSYVVTPAANIGLGSPGTPSARDRSSIYCCGEPTLMGTCSLCSNLLGFSYVNVPLPRALLQEWVHTYGIDFDRTDMTPTILDGAGHWGRFTDINSLLTAGGGAGSTIDTINPDGSGTFFCEFAPGLHAYDLYVMGLLSAADLPDARVLNGPMLPLAPCDTPQLGTFTSLFTHTAADLVTANGGARGPFPGVTAYNAAIIVVTPDASFTAAERAYFELFASFMSSGPAAGVVNQGQLQLSFSAALGTSGLPATLDTTIVLR